MTQTILLLLAVLAANLPWFSDRLFFTFSVKQPKSVGWCLLELVVIYLIVGVIALYAEQSTMGQIEPKKWEFYTITACMFLVFSFPGFVYRFFWKKA